MESIAVGKPTIAACGTCYTAFMNDGNSWLVDYDWVPVLPALYAEIPAYKGHRCVEVRPDDLIDKIRYVMDNPGEAEARAKRGQMEVCARFNLEVVGKQWAEVLGPIIEARQPPGTHQPDRTETRPVPIDKVPEGRTESSPVPTENASIAATSNRSGKRSRLKSLIPGEAKTVIMTTSQEVAYTPLDRAILPLSPSRRLNLRIIGEFFVWHSLGLCNREIARRFAVDPDLSVSIVPLERPEFGTEFDPGLQVLVDRTCVTLISGADFEIRHHYPPRLNRPSDPKTKLILIAPWEYYRLPLDWIRNIIENVTEVWAYSEPVKKCYVDSGVPEEMVKVISLGVDTRVFRPDAPPYQFTDEPGAHRLAGFEKPPTVFLAVGTIERKGINTLLEAYCNTFSLYDNVVLVVKDTCVNTVYRGGTQGERLRELANSPTGPAVIYIEQELPPAEHAGLFTAAHLVCLPYLNEGFCLPALEAMASGRPPCVPAGGPTADFCDSTNAIIVPAALESMGTNRIGDIVCCGETSRLVINPRDFGRAMRWAHEHPEETAALGTAAAKHAREKYTWEHTVDAMKARLVALAGAGDASTQENRRAGACPPPTVGTSAQETKNQRINESPKLTLVSGMEIVDRRSVNTAKQTPGTAQTPDFPAVLRAKPRIALTGIMRDEEKVLPAFLGSVKPLFTVIYLVDTGSTDSSVQIARDYGAIVSHRPWDFSFSNARNYAQEQMRGEEFAAFADCDDTLPPECGEGIQRLIMMADDRVSGWLMQVHIPPPPGGEGFTIVDHLKIWRGGRGYRWTGRIHEQLLGSIRATGGVIERTNLYFVHSGYDYSAPGQKKKRDRDEYLLRLDEKENPDASFPRFNSGMSRFHWGEFDTAIVKFQECIERADPHESTMRKVYAMLCGSYLAKRDLDNARKAIETGLSLTPNDPELLFRAGNLFRDLGDLPVAERYYIKLLTERESGHIDSRDVSIETYKGHHNAAGLYVEMGRLQDAEMHLRAALQHRPTFAPSLVELGSLFVRQRRFQDAADVAARLDAVDPALAQALRQNLAAAQNTRAI